MKPSAPIWNIFQLLWEVKSQIEKQDKSDFKSPLGSKTTLGQSRAGEGRSGGRSMEEEEEEEKMQFCADIGMSGSRGGGSEWWGMRENKEAWME